MTASPQVRDLVRLRESVRARLGLWLPDSRVADLERAVVRAREAAGPPGTAPLGEVLAGRPGVSLDAFVAGLNLGETYFFRDAAQMRALEQRILPELIRRRWGQRRLRVWSAGCSTGEEAYSLAMLVHRLTGGLPDWAVSVLGSDINGCSLRWAARGVYRSWSLRAVPPSVRAAYLCPHAEGAEVAPRVRAMVRFSWLNLAGDAYPSARTGTEAMDLIVCRNVLLYFDAAQARAVLRRLRAALAEGGWLLLGQVEAVLGEVDGLRRVRTEPAAFQRGPAAGNEAGGEPGGEAGGGRRPAVASPVAPVRSVAAPPVGGSGPVPSAAEVDGARVVEACTRAVRLWRTGQHRQALAVLAGEADRARLQPGVHYLHGLVLLDCGLAAAALAAFRRCTYADPGFVLGYVGQAGALARAGQRRRAGAALDSASRLLADLDPDGQVPDGVLPDAAASAGAVRGLIAAQRRLLDADAVAGRG